MKNALKLSSSVSHTRKTIWVVIAVGFLSLCMFVYSYLSWQTALQKYIPLLDNISNAKVNLAKGHLWFEELISGDETIQIEAVQELFNKSFQNINDSTGGKSHVPGIKGKPSTDLAFLDQLHQLETMIMNLQSISEKRWEMRTTSGIGSTVDQHFDEIFGAAQYKAEEVIKSLYFHINTNLSRQRFIHVTIFGLWAAIISGVTIMLLMSNRKNKRTEEAVSKLLRAVECSPCTVLITNTSGNIEYSNPKFVQLTGYSTKEVIGKNPRILKSGITSSEVYEQLWGTITSGRE